MHLMKHTDTWQLQTPDVLVLPTVSWITGLFIAVCICHPEQVHDDDDDDEEEEEQEDDNDDD
ncbi:hypothetical protein ElyMa_002492500, partial [Elysia marginata]